jgi:deoxyribonuclease V
MARFAPERDSGAVASYASWPTSADELRRQQRQLAAARPPEWHPPADTYAIGACIMCVAHKAPGHGRHGEVGWAGAAVSVDRRIVGSAVATGRAGAAYEPGLLALREGALLEAAVRALPHLPDVLLVNATGRDHPRGAGLALHLGAVLGLPTVGVTHRPLLARGESPPDERGARSPLVLDEEAVGCWLRTRLRARPLAVHPGWRTDLDAACVVVLAAVGRMRAPEPLREARRVARRARAGLQLC